MQNLTRHLLSLEHGAFAFIVTQSAGGDAHAWAAVNHGGTVLFLDPQTRKLSEDVPLYTHNGGPSPSNVVTVSALVTNPNGEYATVPAHLSPRTTSIPDPMGGVDDSGAEDAEHQALESLSTNQRRLLDEAERTSREVADRILRDLSEVTTELNPSADPEGPKLVKTESRVKEQGSIARTYLAESPLDRSGLASFLADMKDRVRFTVQVPEGQYGSVVNTTLRSMASRGYAVKDFANFWGSRGRHSGLNVTLVDPTNTLVEVQFPTRLSFEVGEDTHDDYKKFRESRFSFSERVDAFLSILRKAKERELYDHMPAGLDLLPPMRPKDTSFGRWVRRNSGFWQAYLDDLAAEGRSFAEVLESYGLTQGDAFPGEGNTEQQ